MRTFRDCAIAALALLLALGSLELGLRAAGVKFEASLYEQHSVLYTVYRANSEGWTIKEGENYVHINNLGMRDRERSIEAPSGTIRLAVLGDSLVAALQVPLENTMTQVLESGLTQTMKEYGRQVEVLNFAVGGYALSQMYLSLDERVWAFHPDIVAVCVSNLTVPNSYRKTKSLNDLPFFTLEEDRLIPDKGNQPPVFSSDSMHWHQVFGDLHNQFRLLQLARNAQQSEWRNAFTFSKLAKTNAAESQPAEFMRVWPYRQPESLELVKAWDITEAILSRMIDAAQDHGAEFWLIQIGNDIEEDSRDIEREKFLSVNKLNDFSYASKRYEAFTKQHGAHYLYLAPPMREYSARTGLPLRGFFNTKPYAGHWNKEGNEAAAKTIQSELLRNSRFFTRQSIVSNMH